MNEWIYHRIQTVIYIESGIKDEPFEGGYSSSNFTLYSLILVDVLDGCFDFTVWLIDVASFFIGKVFIPSHPL